MRVLIACEYSGVVRRAFAALGHDVVSADFEPAEDADPNHYQGDCFDLIDNLPFDLMIAHPPCTYLSASGMHWTTRGLRDPKLTDDALDFVRRLMAAPIPRIAVENPVSVIATRIRPFDQLIQPWWFGDDASKKTCLWLKGLAPLEVDWRRACFPRSVCCGHPMNTEYYKGQIFCPTCGKPTRFISGNQTPSGQNKLGPSPDRWKERSRTYSGIAKAMADQWGRTQA